MSNFRMMEDSSLVSKILGGDLQAYGQFIQQHQRLVYHMISRVVSDPEDCAELCQDVFLKVYQKLGSFQFQSKVSTWVARIAYHHAINHIRKKKVATSALDDLGTWELPDPGSATDFETRDLEEQVMVLVDRLPPAYRLVLCLYHLENKNYAEIGEITGMPEGTVKNYLFRARAQLKEKMKNYLNENISL